MSKTKSMTQQSHPHVWSSARIAETYLAFFEQHGHLRLAGHPLAAPENSTSFIIAGMQPLMPYLRGSEPPPAPRLAALQRCLRTDDVEMVGSNDRKMSAFQMLGNWSIGDYGRREAVELAVELLSIFGIDWQRLWITTFGGDPSLNLPPDEDIVAEWLRAGIPGERIVPLGAEDNFWTTGGPGPCGRDTELFIDRGEAFGCGRQECRPGCDCNRFLEFWNLVFIEFEQHPDGSITPLPLRSVDTGMGLERMALLLQGAPSAFHIDLFLPAQQRLHSLLPNEHDSHDGHGHDGQPSAMLPAQREQSQRMIVDHMRAALFVGAEGTEPGRDGRGSVLRRLIRRAATRGRLLGITRPFLSELLMPLAQAHGALLSEEEQQRVPLLEEMVRQEEQRFQRTLTAGLRMLDSITPGERGVVPGELLFQLHAERGFPADLAAEILAQRGLQVEWPSFERATQAHREVSRSR